MCPRHFLFLLEHCQHKLEYTIKKTPQKMQGHQSSGARAPELLCPLCSWLLIVNVCNIINVNLTNMRTSNIWTRAIILHTVAVLLGNAQDNSYRSPNFFTYFFPYFFAKNVVLLKKICKYVLQFLRSAKITIYFSANFERIYMQKKVQKNKVIFMFAKISANSFVDFRANIC